MLPHILMGLVVLSMVGVTVWFFAGYDGSGPL